MERQEYEQKIKELSDQIQTYQENHQQGPVTHKPTTLVVGLLTYYRFFIFWFEGKYKYNRNSQNKNNWSDNY